MSYIRKSSILRFVDGESEDYVFSDYRGFTEDYGKISDKGFVELLFRYCQKLSIQAVIPMRDYGSKPIYRGKSLRRICKKNFNKKTYNRREVVESVFSAIKRKFGASVSSVKFSAQKAEMYCRAITHNIFLILLGLFERSRFKRHKIKNELFILL